MGHAKGTILIGAVKHLRSQRQEASKILPEELHHYLEERVSPASWYPEADVIALIRALVQLLPGSADEILHGFGVVTAQSLGQGIYAHLVREGASNSGIFALWASMHDTGELTISSRDDHEVSFDLVGYEHTSPEMCAIVGSYIQETIRMSDRPTATVTKLTCTLHGADACRWRVTW